VSKFNVGDKVKITSDFYDEDDYGAEKGTVHFVSYINDDGIVIRDKNDSFDVFLRITDVKLVESAFVVASRKIIKEGVAKMAGPPIIGPTKHNKNKPMMSLVRPEFTRGIAEALTYGYTKYDEQRGDIQNYLKGDGFYYSTILDSLERHIGAFKSGVDIDEESGIHHLLMAATNLMFLHTYEVSDKGKDDRVVLNEKI